MARTVGAEESAPMSTSAKSGESADGGGGAGTSAISSFLRVMLNCCGWYWLLGWSHDSLGLKNLLECARDIHTFFFLFPFVFYAYYKLSLYKIMESPVQKHYY